MKNGIVNELITAMKERIPKGQNLANSLADILYMGKEAVYRVSRGLGDVYKRQKKPSIADYGVK